MTGTHREVRYRAAEAALWRSIGVTPLERRIQLRTRGTGIRVQEVGSGPPWYTTWDRRAAAASISGIADLEPSVLASGHGQPLTGPGTAAAVHAFAARKVG